MTVIKNILWPGHADNPSCSGGKDLENHETSLGKNQTRLHFSEQNGHGVCPCHSSYAADESRRTTVHANTNKNM
jgi:hypothetical protein